MRIDIFLTSLNRLAGYTTFISCLVFGDHKLKLSYPTARIGCVISSDHGLPMLLINRPLLRSLCAKK